MKVQHRACEGRTKGRGSGPHRDPKLTRFLHSIRQEESISISHATLPRPGSDAELSLSIHETKDVIDLQC
jgi:hypothetical protein